MSHASCRGPCDVHVTWRRQAKIRLAHKRTDVTSVGVELTLEALNIDQEVDDVAIREVVLGDLSVAHLVGLHSTEWGFGNKVMAPTGLAQQ
jgi:hypothetical protein